MLVSMGMAIDGVAEKFIIMSEMGALNIIAQ